jgi:hypothetical protein
MNKNVFDRTTLDTLFPGRKTSKVVGYLVLEQHAGLHAVYAPGMEFQDRVCVVDTRDILDPHCTCGGGVNGSKNCLHIRAVLAILDAEYAKLPIIPEVEEEEEAAHACGNGQYSETVADRAANSDEAMAA